MAARQGVSSGTLNVAVISAGDCFFRSCWPSSRARAGRQAQPGRVQSRAAAAAAGDNLTDLAVTGAPAARARHRQRGVRAPPLRDRGAARPPAGAIAQRLASERVAARTLARRESAAPIPGTRWKTAFGEQLAKLNVTMEIRSTETIKQAVIAGMGISFLSAHTIGRELEMQQLAVLDVVGFPPQAAVVRGASAPESAGAGGDGVQGLSARARRRPDRPGHRQQCASPRAVVERRSTQVTIATRRTPKERRCTQQSWQGFACARQALR